MTTCSPSSGREEGIDGLYKGVGNKFVQSVLTAAILFVGQKSMR